MEEEWKGDEERTRKSKAKEWTVESPGDCRYLLKFSVRFGCGEDNGRQEEAYKGQNKVWSVLVFCVFHFFPLEKEWRMTTTQNLREATSFGQDRFFS